ncbi:hypothetical protein ACFRJ8_14765 [Arthrobacter sp. NPDC056886]|uniref:hypothetical protein n=1 Tax=Arthrobacter sp. NPDC056886 TaxID=3345960 RepID=UPI0036713378
MMISDEAVEAAAKELYEIGNGELFSDADNEDRQHMTEWATTILKAAGPRIRAQVLEEMAASVLTNDPLDFWDMHLPEGLGFQEAVSRWLKAYARAEMSQTPDDFATHRSQA